MKKVISIFIILIMLINLTACGGKSSDVKNIDVEDPNVGKWNAVLVFLDDDEIEINDMYQKGISLDLKSNGDYSIDWDGIKQKGKWSFKDDILVISLKDSELTGTILDGVLIIMNAHDLGMDITFEKEGGYDGKIKPKTIGEAGYYILEEGKEDGETISGDEFRDMGFDYYIILNDDGTAITQTDDLGIGTWKNGIMILSNNEGDMDEIEYIIEGDYLTIDLDGLVLIYLRSNDIPPEINLATSTLSEVQEWWDGDWYGYWETYSETEIYKDFEDVYRECFGLIEMNEDDSGDIYLWDPLGDFARANVTVNEYGGQGYMGAAVSNNGNLWFGEEIGHAGWIIDPSIYGYDNYMVIDGRYEDEFGGGFNYVVYLKPWGEDWDEFTAEERPPWYDTWYMSAYKAATMWEAIDDRDAHIHTEIENIPEIGDYLSAYREANGIEAPEEEESEAVVVPSGKLIEVMYEIESGVKISAMLPEGKWCSKGSWAKVWLHDKPSLNDVYSNSPVIILEIKPEVEGFDFYKEDFLNLKNIDNRTIAGIDMVGRTYENIGMDWIEYTGVINDKNAVSVRISRMDVSSGEASQVLDSIKIE